MNKFIEISKIMYIKYKTNTLRYSYFVCLNIRPISIVRGPSFLVHNLHEMRIAP